MFHCAHADLLCRVLGLCAHYRHVCQSSLKPHDLHGIPESDDSEGGGFIPNFLCPPSESHTLGSVMKVILDGGNSYDSGTSRSEKSHIESVLRVFFLECVKSALKRVLEDTHVK